MSLEIKEDTHTLAAILAGITSLCGVVFGYILKSRKTSIKHIEESWEGLIEDSASFREEIRQDMKMVKEERDRLRMALENLEKKLEEVVRENIELKLREMELAYELRRIKAERIE